MAEVQCFFSDNPKLLEQYYRIREESYRKILKLEDYDGSSDTEDLKGFNVLAVQDERCIGGARLDVNLVECSRMLPLEIAGYDPKQDFHIFGSSCCQITNLAIELTHPQKATIAEQLVRLATEGAQELGCELLFSYAPPIHTRLYRGFFHRLGLEMKSHPDIEVPLEKRYAGLRPILSSCVIRSTSLTKSQNIAI